VVNTQPNLQTILVVDNDPAILAYFAHFLDEEGYTVYTARDGLAALEILDEHTPDVLFIDFVMPNIDGGKLGQIIRSMPKMRESYLIMISAISKEDEIDVEAYGFNACIAKGPMQPFKENVLTVLDELGKGITPYSKPKIYGLQDLYKRGITQELLSSKRHFELILNNLSESILELTLDARIIYANPAAAQLCGVKEEKLLASQFVDLFDPQERQRIRSLLSAAENTPQRISDIDPALLKGKQLALNLLPVKEAESRTIIAILDDVTDRRNALMELHEARDNLEKRVQERTEELAQTNKQLREEIAERKRAQEQTQASLREKETLLKEVHHRVKNNLQIISSLHQLQIRKTEDSEITHILTETQNRVQSIALVHEELYNSADLSSIEFKDYVENFSTMLSSAYGIDPSRIMLIIEVEELYFDIDKAIPCGLIINELLSNAFKYAFPDEREGAVTISCFANTDQTITLKIADNGVGLPPDFDIETVPSLGLKIVVTLVDQINGTLHLDKEEGTTYTITFPE
jgi:PAS domain S-box-containing protein